jgi:ketosteroid isomerase-like protein
MKTNATQTKELTGQELLQTMYGYFQRGEINHLLEHLSPNCEWQDFTPVIATRGLRRGPQAIGEWFAALNHEAHFENFQPRTYLNQGNSWVVLGSYKATIRQTGRTLDATFVHVFTLQGDKVKSWRGYGEADKLIEAYMPHHN